MPSIPIRMLKFTTPFWHALCVLILAVSLAACTDMVNYEDPDGPIYMANDVLALMPKGDRLKVVTYNIQFGENMQAAAGVLGHNPALADIDLLLVQEIDEQDAELLAQEMGFNYAYVPVSVHERHDQNFGNAILSPWPLHRVNKVPLPHENPRNGQRRMAISAEMEVGGRQVLVYSVHMETWWLTPLQRRDQIQALLASVPVSTKYVIIGGDFNTMTTQNVAAQDREFNEKGFQRVSEGAGATVSVGPLRLPLDHIYARGMTAISSGLVEDVNASDHFPLWVVVQVE